MPAPTPFKDPDSAVATASPSKAKALTLNEQIKLKALLKGEDKKQEEIKVPAPRKYGRDELKAKTQYLSQRLMDYLLDGDRLERLMAETKLKDLGVLFGITTEKVLLLEGQPTQIMGHVQQAKIDEIGQKVQDMLRQRGLDKKITLTERKVEIEAK